MNVWSHLDRLALGGAGFAFVLGATEFVARLPSDGLNAFFGYVVVGGLGFHTYDVMLYPAFSVLVLRRIWGAKWWAALLLVWGINEGTFNATYAAGYGSLTHPANEVYLALMVVFLAVGVGVLRPKVSLGLATFVWPAFLGGWVEAGQPLIFTIGGAPVWSNWPWELGYQVALFLTFVSTFYPNDYASTTRAPA